MASNQGNNNIVSGTRSTRLNSFDRVPIVKSPSRLGNGFAANSRAWDSNANIWANENNLNPFAEGAVDPELHNGTALDSNGDVRYPRGKSGSGSLLSSSESVSWEHRSNLPWNTGANHSSPVSPRQQGPAHSSSQLRNAELTTNTAGLQSDYRDMSPFLPIGQHSRFDTADNGLQEPPRRSNNTSEQRKSNSYTYGNLYNLSHEDDGPGGINGSNFRASDSSGPIQSGLRFLNTAHEVRPLPSGRFQRTSLAAHSRNNFDLPEAQPRLPQASNPPNLRYNSTAHSSSRRPGAHNSAPSGRQDSALQFDGQDDQLLLKFHGMNLQTEVMPQDFTPGFQTQVSSQRTASKLGRSLQVGFSRPKNHISSEYFSLADPQPALSDGTADTSCRILADYRQSLSFGEPESSSPALSDRRRGLGSPLYSTNTGTPSSGPGSVRSASDIGLSNPPSNGQMVTLDCEPRGSRPFHLEEHYMLSNTSHARLQYSQPFEIDGYPGSLRLNPLAVPYPIPTYGGLINSYQPRYPSREHDSSQIVRSALLEEFRANHKTSKRYELKDIYNHVVEFSGDQHGSRFIQQKLETANSDEKDQIFAEIQPNSLQLMTDVFGNYVIQKLFEHGNQTQKKILANQMKSRVMDLSTQMYGCRVVQKALEHILTDQQASMVKELEAHVLKCVKDQNGNHVIQKAIERVPAEHVQFIVNAFTGQVSRLAAHPYGCRVIQRMLEHCEEPARQSILRELHTGVYPLITDQYGNYVIQHVIEKGHEYDRTKVVATVISQLLSFSKHKFASNVVEKSIQCAEAGQRAEILRILTTPNDKGESPLLGLMRDQYGNYVIQKSLGDFGFKDEEREHLVEHCKPEFSKLKRFSSGKQVMALEKLIFEGDSEPNLSSSQSSTIPSTNTSTVEGPTTLTLPPVHILKSSFIPEPATSVASTP